MNPFGLHLVVSFTMISLTSTYLLPAAIENEWMRPEMKLHLCEMIFPTYSSIQQYSCFVRATRINFHDVNQQMCLAKSMLDVTSQ